MFAKKQTAMMYATQEIGGILQIRCEGGEEKELAFTVQRICITTWTLQRGEHTTVTCA